MNVSGQEQPLEQSVSEIIRMTAPLPRACPGSSHESPFKSGLHTQVTEGTLE